MLSRRRKFLSADDIENKLMFTQVNVVVTPRVLQPVRYVCLFVYINIILCRYVEEDVAFDLIGTGLLADHYNILITWIKNDSLNILCNIS